MKKTVNVDINSCEKCTHCYIMNENTSSAKNMCILTNNEVPRRHRIADDCPLSDTPEPKPIYLVTTIKFASGYGDRRCVGYFHDYQDAIELVSDNGCDIAEEGYYRYIVIESVKQGIYMQPVQEDWFTYNKEMDLCEPCDKPEKLKNVVSFGIG